MSELHVEELESRQLLNAPGTLFPPPPLQAPGVLPHSFLMTERMSFMDSDGHIGALGGFEAERVSVLRIIYSPDLGGTDPVQPDQGRQEAPVASLEIEGSPARAVPNRFASRPGGSGIPPTALSLSGVVATAAMEPPGTSRGANVASAGVITTVLFERPDSQPRPLPGNLGAGGAFPAFVQGPSAQRSLGYVAPVQIEASGGAVRPRESAIPYNGPGTSGTAEQAGGSVLPSPQLSDALAVLPPLDISGIEIGIQEFLKGLERLTPHLTGERDGTDLWPWIVALGAAAFACEIARRELKRPPDLPSAETSGM